ncbi:glycosyltransferase family 2 protein [Macromonas nakdongensis]|uniref:glycosyltransferase family 2 protein n=1 Tax=Macromonas nakdongensis TaxID=1843082 RepID=UPI000C3229D3|nr:glycosyltransferase family 2 protein [Macromonas nakdongensis]
MKKINRSIADVSTIIPCYNCVDTIRRAIESIAAQTVLPAEVILVNDCSSDGTLELLKKIQSKYSDEWIQVIDLHKNSGPGEARNAGWSVARQNYIAFLDADDAWHPQKIEIQYGWMSKNPDILLTGHSCAQWDTGKSLPNTNYNIDSIKCLRITKVKLLLKNYFSTRSVMLRRDVPYRFVSGKFHAEDYLLWLQLACKSNSLITIDLPLAYLFKAPYGEGGLSAQLWKMQRGEIDVYRRIRDEGEINFATYMALTFWSLIRFCRRLMITALRK